MLLIQDHSDKYLGQPSTMCGPEKCVCDNVIQANAGLGLGSLFITYWLWVLCVLGQSLDPNPHPSPVCKFFIYETHIAKPTQCHEIFLRTDYGQYIEAPWGNQALTAICSALP